MGLLAYIGDLLRRLAGVAAAMLPRRWWPKVDLYVPASDSAFWSGLVTFLAGALIGIQGFLTYATQVASDNNRLLIEAATRPGAGELTSAGPVAFSALALFNFLILTPEGWATTYLSLTGFVRAVGASFDDPRGDLLLGILDRTWMGLSGSVAGGQARRRRETLEGPEVRDRVVRGTSVGCPDADLVIVASRRKEGWDTGTVVLTGSGSYRVGTIVERTIGGHLRTLYPLSEHKDLEVFRRTVRYELPPGTTEGSQRPGSSADGP